MTASLLGFAVLGGLPAIAKLVARAHERAPDINTPAAGSAS